MNKYGIQYEERNIQTSVKNMSCICNDNILDEIEEIKKVLYKFQRGYIDRDIERVDTFAKELFINSDELFVLGTSTGEALFGLDDVKELLKDDWEDWGDLKLDCENAHVSVNNTVAWFSINGTVKYNFEHDQDRYDRYVDYIKTNAEDTQLTPKQRVTFINWVLSLNYHQREEGTRDYFWPMCLSGVMLKKDNAWKIAQLQFSIAKSNFPDERFESSKETIDNFNEQIDDIKKVNNSKINDSELELFKSFEKDITNQENISDNIVKKYFSDNDTTYIVGPENKWYEGIEQIKEFFINSDMGSMNLDLDNAIIYRKDNISWTTVIGTTKVSLTEDELINRSLMELDNIFKSDMSSQEKLFASHRSIAYVLKECASGVDYTCPIRLTAVISNEDNNLKIKYMHLSYSFDWIFEGKLDNGTIMTCDK